MNGTDWERTVRLAAYMRLSTSERAALGVSASSGSDAAP
jgi:hypothetical protein